VAAIALIIVFDVSVTRRRGQGVNPKAMAVIPVLSGGWTGWQVFGALVPAGVTIRDVTFLTVGAATALILGVPRGQAVLLWRKDGYLHQRYGRRSLLLWAALGTFAIALAAVAHRAGARHAGGPNTVGLLLSLGDLAELYTIYPLALASGVPFPPPRQPRRARGRHRAGRAGGPGTGGADIGRLPDLGGLPYPTGPRLSLPGGRGEVGGRTQPVRRLAAAGVAARPAAGSQVAPTPGHRPAPGQWPAAGSGPAGRAVPGPRDGAHRAGPGDRPTQPIPRLGRAPAPRGPDGPPGGPGDRPSG